MSHADGISGGLPAQQPKSKTSACRVLRKTCRNQSLTLYIGGWDYFEDDAIEGVVAIDPRQFVEGRLVFVRISTFLDTGRKGLEQFGVEGKSVAASHEFQVYPSMKPDDGHSAVVSSFQERLIRKISKEKQDWNTFPFSLRFPKKSPYTSLLVKQVPPKGNMFGYVHEVMAYSAIKPTPQPDRSYTSKININRFPDLTGSCIDDPRTRCFSNTPKFGGDAITVNATLDQKMYNPGSQILLDLDIQNESSTVLKSLSLRVLQITTVNIPESTIRKQKHLCTISQLDYSDGFPLRRGETLKRELTFDMTKPQISDMCAVVCSSGSSEARIAPTTPRHMEYGIIVAYALQIKVKKCSGLLPSSLSFEVPFVWAYVRDRQTTGDLAEVDFTFYEFTKGKSWFGKQDCKKSESEDIEDDEVGNNPSSVHV